ncbi:MAG: hypothetical protein ACJ748_03585 [Flavisolibacter sp.]
MPIQIEINDTHVDALIGFYIQRLRVLREEIAAREKETKDINAQILRLKKSKNESQSNGETADSTVAIPSVPYSDKWPWVKKIRFAIEQQGRALTTKEIVDTLIEHEIGLMFDRKKAVASISSMLSTKSGENKAFIRVESDSGDFAYDINNIEEEDKEANPFI